MKRPTKEESEKFNAYYNPDTDFAAYARLLQSKWRESKGFPPGKLGNYLEKEFAIATKSNYLTDKIKTLVQYEVYRANVEGKLISEPRIWDNLLSSQPLCFNLFGELHYNLKLATKFFKAVFPSRIGEVTAVKFEHSPARGHIDYTSDHSAFDVFIEYKSKENKRGFIGIEVKYAETLKDDKAKTEATFKKHEEAYLKIANISNLFSESSTDFLAKVPLQQIWRDHLLAVATLKDYDEGFFVFLFPSENKECQDAIDAYKKQLKKEDEALSNFYPRHLEDFIRTLRKVVDEDWSKELEERYLGQY